VKPLQRKAINHKLNMAGLASLENPDALLSQVALGITDHDKFRSLLLKCEPDQRYNCYYSLKHRLRFEAKPLETYIMEGKQQAERERLPVYDHETGKLREFDAPAPLNINALAEKAIAQREAEENAKGRLALVCRRCTFEDYFFATTKVKAHEVAAEKGWYFEEIGLHVRFTKADGFKLKALCPKCAPKQIQ